MVLGSPSASLANKLVFWSPEDPSAVDGDYGGNGTAVVANIETEASTHDGVSMYVKVFEGTHILSHSVPYRMHTHQPLV